MKKKAQPRGGKVNTIIPQQSFLIDAFKLLSSASLYNKKKQVHLANSNFADVQGKFQIYSKRVL